MRRIITTAAVVALTALPLALGPTAASASCRGRANTGTVIGGVGGALLGNSIKRGGAGAVIGGLGGAVIGHQIAKSGCTSYSRHAYYRRHHRTGYASNSHTYYQPAYRSPGYDGQTYSGPAYSGQPYGGQAYYDQNGNLVRR